MEHEQTYRIWEGIFRIQAVYTDDRIGQCVPSCLDNGTVRFERELRGLFEFHDGLYISVPWWSVDRHMHHLFF